MLVSEVQKNSCHWVNGCLYTWPVIQNQNYFSFSWKEMLYRKQPFCQTQTTKAFLPKTNEAPFSVCFTWDALINFNSQRFFVSLSFWQWNFKLVQKIYISIFSLNLWIPLVQCLGELSISIAWFFKSIPPSSHQFVHMSFVRFPFIHNVWYLRFVKLTYSKTIDKCHFPTFQTLNEFVRFISQKLSSYLKVYVCFFSTSFFPEMMFQFHFAGFLNIKYFFTIGYPCLLGNSHLKMFDKRQHLQHVLFDYGVMKCQIYLV